MTSFPDTDLVRCVLADGQRFADILLARGYVRGCRQGERTIWSVDGKCCVAAFQEGHWWFWADVILPDSIKSNGVGNVAGSRSG